MTKMKMRRMLSMTSWKKHRKTEVNDMKIILGDLNAKVGWEESARATIGKFNAHKESNDNGTRLVNFAASANMVVGITLFPCKLIHKATWRSPDGATQNQTEYTYRF
jgi:hypothetical protein